MGRADKITETLGNRLKARRKELGYTLQALGELTGISVPMLSKIENGRTNVNFQSVLRIAECLDLPVASFLGKDDAPPTGRRAITRANEGKHVELATSYAKFEVLCDDLAHKKNVYWKVEITARSIEEYTSFSSHPGEEFLFVLSGAIELHSKLYKPVLLQEGDCICFDAKMGHAYVSIGETNAQLLMCNSLSSQPISGFLDD